MVDDRNANQSDHLVDVDASGEKTLAEFVRSDILEQAEYRNLILKLRRQGMTASQISDHLATKGISRHPTSIQRFINGYLERLAGENRESSGALRELEDDRLDALLRVYMLKATGGDEKAAALVLKISERRAKLHGLDSPQVVEHRGSVSLLHELSVDPEEIERERESFETAYSRPGLPDPSRHDDIEGTAHDVSEEDVSSADA